MPCLKKRTSDSHSDGCDATMVEAQAVGLVTDRLHRTRPDGREKQCRAAGTPMQRVAMVEIGSGVGLNEDNEAAGG